MGRLNSPGLHRIFISIFSLTANDLYMIDDIQL